MPSLKDIAKQCGVSVASVSKALNDHSDISPKTKKRIRDTADKMGYLPNSQARALKTHITHNIGILFLVGASYPESGLIHEYFACVLEALKTSS